MENEYQLILKQTALNALKRAAEEEYRKIDDELKARLANSGGNQLAEFINEHYPHKPETFSAEREIFVSLVSKRFNMPRGIADQLISYYTT